MVCVCVCDNDVYTMGCTCMVCYMFLAKVNTFVVINCDAILN